MDNKSEIHKKLTASLIAEAGRYHRVMSDLCNSLILEGEENNDYVSSIQSVLRQMEKNCSLDCYREYNHIFNNILCIERAEKELEEMKSR